jgi:pyruvate,water dikinase
MAVKSFLAIEKSDYASIGSKASKLAEMYQAGLPVPPGFVIFADELKEGRLGMEARSAASSLLAALQETSVGTRFAVRSSAAAEDSLSDSYAGIFESVLGLSTEEQVIAAVQKVAMSSASQRAKAYALSRKALPPQGGIACIVMAYVEAEMAGVLFTASPATGSHTDMQGNLSFGPADRLLSGDENGMAFHLFHPSGKYAGPVEFRPYAKKLYRLACRIANREGVPQDIEFAVKGGSVYILQARPITSLVAEKLDTYKMNDSLDGDMLWTKTNVGEAMTDVFTPLTFSVHRLLDEAAPSVPGYRLVSGNILGRVYTNISRKLSFSAKARIFYPAALTQARLYYGDLPADIPVYPYRNGEYIALAATLGARSLCAGLKASRKLAESLQAIPGEAASIAREIESAAAPEALAHVWERRLLPLALKANGILRFAFDRDLYHFMTLKPRLSKALGEADANALLSRAGGEGLLASLGPLVGLSEILAGKMTKEEYREKYGHRGAHEFELSIPDESENPKLLDEKLEQFRKESFDLDALFERQKARYDEAVARLAEKMPKRSEKIMKLVEFASRGAQKREAIRTQWTRSYRLLRPFYAKAAELLSLGENVYFYYADEVVRALKGEGRVSGRLIQERKKSYERYLALPEPPAYIRGPYRPENAAAQRASFAEGADQTVLSGFGGASGIVTAKVRVLRSPEEAGALEKGEILVAPTTNIGWSSVFPKTAAIVTDVGAPLSHATIIARELGIPAVVGCKGATSLLRDGDVVTVDGGAGLVRLAPRPVPPGPAA